VNQELEEVIGTVEDSDFDVMFSGKSDPMIGSFKHVIAMPEEIVAAGFTSHSYFAQKKFP
jgi:hypothetical protein